MRDYVGWIVILGMLTDAVPAPAGEESVLEVSAPSSLPKGALVVWQLPDALQPMRDLRLQALDSAAEVPVQRLGSEPECIAWLLDAPLAAGATRRYRLSSGDVSADIPERQGGVHCDDDGTRLRLTVAGQPLLEYHTAVVEPPPGIARHFRRSGHLHPVFAPSGAVVTDDFAPDHAHQHGVFFAWVSTSFAGREVDFWNQAKREGDVEHAEVLETTSGPVWGGFRVRLNHVELGSAAGSQTVLEETWNLRAYHRSDGFVFDLESRQQGVADWPLRINEYHYGGMGLRGSRQWSAAERSSVAAEAIPGRFLTSEGKQRHDGNHTRPDWVSIYGPTGEGQSTITVMSHPENFRHPQPVRLHPTMPYFCFAPMVLGEFEIRPGEVYLSRYRFVIYDGPPDRQRNQSLWHEYAAGPTVTRVAPR